MANPFRNKTMRSHYDAAVSAYLNKDSCWYYKKERRGTKRLPAGDSFSSYFWKGYDNVSMNWDAQSKKMIAYPYYRAGQDMAKYKE